MAKAHVFRAPAVEIELQNWQYECRKTPHIHSDELDLDPVLFFFSFFEKKNMGREKKPFTLQCDTGQISAPTPPPRYRIAFWYRALDRDVSGSYLDISAGAPWVDNGKMYLPVILIFSRVKSTLYSIMLCAGMHNSLSGSPHPGAWGTGNPEHGCRQPAA